MSTTGAKILAVFLVTTMVLSSIAYFSGNTNQQSEQEASDNLTYNQTVDFLDIGGELINEPFTSIKDALNITPPGAVRAEYVNLEKTTGTPLGQFISSQLQREGLPVDELNRLYGATTTHLYFADFSNRSFILMTRFEPQVVAFNFIIQPYKNYNLLIRQDTGATNVMGNPTLYGPPRDIINTLDTIDGNRSNTSYREYRKILDAATPAEYQLITNNISFAEQFYLGLGTQEDNTYQRTTIYLHPRPELLKTLNLLKQNSTQRGITSYNITTTENLTIVNIKSPSLLSVLQEKYQ